MVDDRRIAISVALSVAERRALETAAAADMIPVTTWIRAQALRECARRGISVR